MTASERQTPATRPEFPVQVATSSERRTGQRNRSRFIRSNNRNVRVPRGGLRSPSGTWDHRQLLAEALESLEQNSLWSANKGNLAQPRIRQQISPVEASGDLQIAVRPPPLHGCNVQLGASGCHGDCYCLIGETLDTERSPLIERYSADPLCSAARAR